MAEIPETGRDEGGVPGGTPVSEEGTGHPVVDEVLASMRGLQDRPVEEHVAIFEAAHGKLRAALTDAAERPDRNPGS